jgi:hypothetical protein
MEADSIRDDYKNALTEIRRNSNNITMSKEGVIDAKTYGAYKAILASSSCNIPSLEKNFNKMKEYVLGERHSTDKKSAYQTTTDYLYKKVMAGYKETHNWKDSTDFLNIVKKDINGEIDSIHFEAQLDYFTMLLLNNMAYKVREYEVQNGIYKPAEGEKPYAYYQNFETDLSKAMSKFNEAYKKVIDANNKDGKMVQAVITLAEPVDGIQVKGFRSFAEAWAQASATNKNFKIELRRLQTNIPVTILIVICFLAVIFLRNSIPYFAALSLNSFGTDYRFNFYDMMDATFLASFHQMCAGIIPLPGQAGISEYFFYYLYHAFFEAHTPAALANNIEANINAAQILWRTMTFYVVLLVGGVVAALYRGHPHDEVQFANRQTFVDLQLATFDERKRSADTLYETKQLSRKEIQKRLAISAGFGDAKKSEGKEKPAKVKKEKIKKRRAKKSSEDDGWGTLNID